MKVARERAEDDRPADRARAEDEDLERVGVLSRQAERGRVLVVDLVNPPATTDEWGQGVSRGQRGPGRRTSKEGDALVEVGRVQQPVRKVVDRVLDDEEDGELPEDRLPGRERHVERRQAEEGAEWVEAGDLRERAWGVSALDGGGCGRRGGETDEWELDGGRAGQREESAH